MELSQNLQGLTRRQAMFATAAGIVFALSMWGFLRKGPGAFGINACLFGLLLLGSLYRDQDLKKFLARVFPFVLICLNFAFYESIYVKTISVFITLPILFIYATHELATKQVAWSLDSVLARLGPALVSHFRWILGGRLLIEALHLDAIAWPRSTALLGRIGKAVIALLLTFCVAVPLLAGADEDFALWAGRFPELITNGFKWIFEQSILTRLCAAIAVASGIGALAFASQDTVNPKSKQLKPVDTLMTASVLFGLIGLYLVFMYFQWPKITTFELPTDFAATERLVKTGFWQLVFLTALNIVLVTRLYRCSEAWVLNLILGFLSVSSLLLISATYKMFMYAAYYGLSHEKFFACYVVLYCAIAFFYLGQAIVLRRQDSPIRFFCLLFIWMYGVACVLPLERGIYGINMELAQLPGSRQDRADMEMFSADILGRVIEDFPQDFGPDGWLYWTVSRVEEVREKEWYEVSLSSLLNNPSKEVRERLLTEVRKSGEAYFSYILEDRS